MIQASIKFGYGVAFNTKARQINGSKAKVAPAVDDFAGGIVHIADDAGTAAHIGDFGFRLSVFVILEIKRSINKREVGKEPLGADPAGQFEQVIVRIGGVIVNALFDFKYLDWKNRSFSLAQASFGRQHNILDDQPSFR
jgi:hypothetical protein